jgi:hypothetical protein
VDADSSEDIDEIVESIDSREGLERITRLLLGDLRRNSDEWENPTLDRYLEALAEVISSAETIYKNMERKTPVEPSWRLFGELLLAARYYE